MRDHILVSYIIRRETCLHNFGGLAVSYLLDINFEQISDRDKTYCMLGMIFGTWCIVKLDYYGTFYITCLIIIIEYYISHMRINIISWI